ncbi:MAG: hypothetical protein LBH96_01740 [Candidatus Peribacteria bacterium]|jgi:hypothetical protein|nr:hypothetical protein [Candidatus Peribacteria bacterium]
MNINNSLNDQNFSESHQEQSWRNFLGKVRISVWETDDGRYIAQIPEKEYIISEEEFEEINTANQHLIHRIKDKIANTDYQNIEMEE